MDKRVSKPHVPRVLPELELLVFLLGCGPVYS